MGAVVSNRGFATFLICGLSINGLVQTHFISLCGDKGLAALPGASMLAMMGAFDFVGTIASGWLSDRYDSRKLLFWYDGLRGLSLMWLPYADFSFYGLDLFAMFYGLERVGWIFAAHQLGAAVAAYGAGLSRTVLMTYSPALYTAGADCTLAAMLASAIRKPQKAT